MPNIRENNAPSGIGLNPSETGVHATEAAARRGGAFFNQASEALNAEGTRWKSTIGDVGDVAVKYMDHREISAGAKNGAQFVARKNDEWNEIAKQADPNDPTVKEKFLAENLEPDLDKFKSGFNTERSQQWAEQFVDNYRKHMSEKTSADMSTLAGIAVKTNYQTTKNMLASSVASDPSSLDFALKSIDHSVGAMADSSPNLDATQSAKVKTELGQAAKEEIVKAAISGMITKNPNVDLDAVQKKYGAYINGAEMKMFQKAAQTQAKVDLLQQKQLETYQRQTNERAAEKAANDNITKNVVLDPATGRPTIKPGYFKSALDIARMPDAPVGLARTLIDWGEHQQNLKNQPVVSDVAVKSELSTRLFDPSKPTTVIDVMRAESQGKLSHADAATMRQNIELLEATPMKGPVYAATMKAAHDRLVATLPGMPGKDSKGAEIYANFVQDFVPQYIAKFRAGTLEPNALDTKDPNSMISKAMQPWKRTAAQMQADYISSVGGLGSSVAVPAAAKPPKVGDVKDGYEYLGGSPGAASSWRKVP